MTHPNSIEYLIIGCCEPTSVASGLKNRQYGIPLLYILSLTLLITLKRKAAGHKMTCRFGIDKVGYLSIAKLSEATYVI
jgi:hypothetical protein